MKWTKIRLFLTTLLLFENPFTAFRRKNKSVNYKVSVTCNYFIQTVGDNRQCDFDQNSSMELL